VALQSKSTNNQSEVAIQPQISSNAKTRKKIKDGDSQQGKKQSYKKNSNSNNTPSLNFTR